MIRPYGLFIWEVVKAHVATAPKRPQTVHYRGEGEFIISGGTLGVGGQKHRCLSREGLRILEERAMPGVGIRQQDGVGQVLALGMTDSIAGGETQTAR